MLRNCRGYKCTCMISKINSAFTVQALFDKVQFMVLAMLLYLQLLILFVVVAVCVAASMATGPWDGGRTHHGSYGGGYGGYGGYGGGYAGGYGVGYGSYGGHRRGNYYGWSIELRGSYVWKAALNPFFLLNDTNKLWKTPSRCSVFIKVYTSLC